MSKKNLYNTVIKNGYSYGSGVSAVLDSRVKMKLNKYGEYEPDISQVLLENDDVHLQKITPNSDLSQNESEIGKELYENVENIKFDRRIGYYKDLYAGYVLEGDYRENASSGGFGTWIFKELLERGLIDGVIHVKENKDKESPILFKYDISKTIEEIKEGAKTKYYSVELSEVIKKIKDTDGKYAVIGIPSFILSIRLLAKYDPIVNERIKFTIGLICGHQKSIKFADSLAWQVGIKPGKLKSINFRKKLIDFPSNNYGIEFTGIINNEEVTITKHMNELIGYDWGMGFFKSHASDFTDDVMNETADITLGDAWLPEYVSDSGGNNVVLVRNEIIGKIIEDGIKFNKLCVDVISVDTIVKSQQSHFQHTQNDLKYRLYQKDRLGEWRPQKRIAASKNIPFFRRKVQNLRMEISKQSHILFSEATELDDLNHFINGMKKYTNKYENLYSKIRILNILKLGPFKIIKKITLKFIR